jgi:hypothetical protein
MTQEEKLKLEHDPLFLNRTNEPFQKQKGKWHSIEKIYMMSSALWYSTATQMSHYMMLHGDAWYAKFHHNKKTYQRNYQNKRKREKKNL